MKSLQKQLKQEIKNFLEKRSNPPTMKPKPVTKFTQADYLARKRQCYVRL